MEYYGSRLDPVELKFYLKAVNALRNRYAFVKADGITDRGSFLRCITSVQYDYPELFYVNFQRFKYVGYEDGWEFRPQYLYSAEETAGKRRKINDIVRTIVQDMSERGLASIYQQCGYIHSYLVRNCRYDEVAMEAPEEKYKAYTIEGPLLDRTGVCQGIAFAYRFMCRKCGIETITVKGVSFRPGTKNYESHAWNIVRAGESAAHIDTTWDMCLTSEGGPIRYDYFFLPDIEMMRDHQYVGYPMCRKMQMSYYERSMSQFREINELKGYIEAKIRNEKKRAGPGIYCFQFKMVNRKETEEEIGDYIQSIVGRLTDRGYSYSFSTNGPQSVFLYKIEIK